MPETAPATVLAGDIGGTKTDLAVFSPERGLRAPLADATFHSADYPSLEAVVHEFLDTVQVAPGGATVGVAGPVVAGRAQVTKLTWMIGEAHRSEASRRPTVCG